MHRTLRLSAALCLTLVAAAGATAQTAVVVDGTVETTAGGVTFPDATTQTTAARREYYAGVVLVAKSGGQFTSVQAALDSITDAAAGKRYLVLVAPGVYAERVTMKSWVDIEGSGPGATVITAPGGGGQITPSTVAGASDSALRSLTVENTGGASFAVGISLSAGSPTLHDLAVEVSGATGRGVAILSGASSPLITEVKIFGTSMANAVVSGVESRDESSADLRHVEIDLSGPGTNEGILSILGSTTEVSFSRVVIREGSDARGIATSTTDPARPASLNARHVRVEIVSAVGSSGILAFSNTEMTLDHVEVEVKGTTAAWSIHVKSNATVSVLHSRVEAKDSSINRALFLDDGTARVGNSLINGAVTLAGASSITCVGAFDDNYTALGATCQ